MPKKLDRETIGEAPWGSEFLKEVELVVAAAVLHEATTGKTVYDDELNKRVGDFARPLDEEMSEEFLGILEVPPNEDAPFKRFDDVFAFVSRKQRGAWAILEADGKYDAIMSDGIGGLGRLPGTPFTYTSSKAPAFNARALYGGALGWLVYNERRRIRESLIEASVAAAAIEPGAVAKHVSIGSKDYTKIELVRKIDDYYAGGGSAFELKGTRRGVRPVGLIVGPEVMMRAFAIPPVLPEGLRPYDGVDRTRSLMERRQAAGQKAWEMLDGKDDVAPLNTTGAFVADSDTLRRIVYKGEGDPEPWGEFIVDFESGQDVVRDARIEQHAMGMHP